LASPISFLQPSVSLAAAFQSSIENKSAVSLQTASSHLSLGFPTGLLIAKHPLITFLEVGTSFLLCGQPQIKAQFPMSVGIFFGLNSEFYSY